MAKYVVIDNRMRKVEKDKLAEFGYNIIEIPTSKVVYPEISSHVDIFCCKVKDKLVVEKSIFENFSTFDNIVSGNKLVEDKYPSDILYNVCIIGDLAVHNFKYTDKSILDLISKYDMVKVNINQGYSKCSIAVIDDNSAIVTDESIAKVLNANGVETLIIDDLKQIKLLKKNNSYSSMNGFIGGVMSKLDDAIFVSGDLNKIDKKNKIRNFIESRNLKVVDFPDLDIIDYGGIIEFQI